MTPRQRLKIVMAGGIPDRVPVEPDISNMIPARLTGRPFWDIYVYQNPRYGRRTSPPSNTSASTAGLRCITAIRSIRRLAKTGAPALWTGAKMVLS